MLPDFRVRQRDYLLEIAKALTQELDLDTLLDRILKFSIEMLAGHAGLIVLRSEEKGWHIHISEGISHNFLHHLTPLLEKIPDNEDPQRFELPEVNRILNKIMFAATLGLISGVGLPLVTRQKVVGVIFIFRSYPGLFSSNDRALLNSFANQAAIVVQNAQFYTALNQNKQRLDAILNSTADGILLLAANLVIEHCNPSFTRIVALPVEKIYGKAHNKVIQLKNLTQDMTLENAVAGGWPLTPHAQLYVEGDLIRKNLPPLPVGITYAPMISENGKLTNIIATVRDIKRFRQAEELKSTFISVISHELKTPIALIKGYVCTLMRDDVEWDREFVNQSLKIIEEEADRLSKLIENLLDATRLQSGGLTLKKSEIFFPEIVERLTTRFKTQTSEHIFKIEFPKDFPIIFTDVMRIEQVISNLISNSIKYSKEGVIGISGQVRSNKIIICVSDEGPGISPQDLPFVFDRFYRSSDIARSKKGAGLGLYLAKSIIEAHDGRIWIDSEKNKGARICFSLPRN